MVPVGHQGLPPLVEVLAATAACPAFGAAASSAGGLECWRRLAACRLLPDLREPRTPVNRRMLVSLPQL